MSEVIPSKSTEPASIARTETKAKDDCIHGRIPMGFSLPWISLKNNHCFFIQKIDGYQQLHPISSISSEVQKNLNEILLQKAIISITHFITSCIALLLSFFFWKYSSCTHPQNRSATIKTKQTNTNIHTIAFVKCPECIFNLVRNTVG